MFGSPTVVRHLLRGIAAAGALALAVVLLGTETWLGTAGGAAVGVGALVLLRGCPVCWTMGLIETVIVSRAHKEEHAAAGPVRSAG